MTEAVYTLYTGDEKRIEKVLLDENLHYLHIVLPQNEALPVHNTNAPVYMSVVRGRLTIGLNGQAPREYAAGTLLKIPYDTEMDVKNLAPATLELTVVKAPPPNI